MKNTTHPIAPILFLAILQTITQSLQCYSQESEITTFSDLNIQSEFVAGKIILEPSPQAKSMFQELAIKKHQTEEDKQLVSDALNGLAFEKLLFLHNHPAYMDEEVINPLSEEFYDYFVLYLEPGMTYHLALERLTNNPSILEAGPIRSMHTSATPNDPKFDGSGHDQWGHILVGLEDAWNIQKGCSQINIAVIDVGFDKMTHNDLDDSWTATRRDETDAAQATLDYYDNQGWSQVSAEDYSGADNNPANNGAHDHGAKCASVLGAETDNNKGMAGAVWNANIVAVKCGYNLKNPQNDESPKIDADNFIKAIDWVVMTGASQVISISIGWRDNTLTSAPIPVTQAEQISMEASLQNARNNNIIAFMAAGNNATNTEHDVDWPAKSEHLICVGGSSPADGRSPGSRWGPELDLVAPSLQIWTTDNSSGYSREDGTSLASPLVAGIAALMLSNNPTLSFDDIYFLITSSATKVGGMGGNSFHNKFGYGRLDAHAALISAPELEDDIVLSNTSISSTRIYCAANSISAQNATTFKNGSDIILRANDEIVYKPGSIIETGSNHVAEIKPVANNICSSSPSPLIDEDNSDNGNILSSDKDISADSEDVSFYPNPTTSLVKIQSNSPINSFKIINAKGQVRISRTRIHQRELTLNLAALPSGIYVIEIISNGTLLHKRLIKN